MILEKKEIMPADLKVGVTYFAKRRTTTAFGNSNDRTIIWLGLMQLQYDSDTVKNGRNYPSISVEKFCKWAGGTVRFQEDDKENQDDKKPEEDT